MKNIINRCIRVLGYEVEISICLKQKERKSNEDSIMQKIRFIREEDDGKLYMITNYRKVKGVIQYSQNGKCWKFPLKKKRAA